MVQPECGWEQGGLDWRLGRTVAGTSKTRKTFLGKKKPRLALTDRPSHGRPQSKAEYIAVTTGSGKYESFTDSATRIRVYGKTAVLDGFVDVKMIDQQPYRVHTLEFYVENNG